MAAHYCSMATRRLGRPPCPEQDRLDFDPKAVPVPTLNPTAPRSRRATLTRACFRLMDRLCQGPAFNVELLPIAGLRYGARKHECNGFLAPGGFSIECAEESTSGIAIYWLETDRPEKERAAALEMLRTRVAEGLEAMRA